MKSFWYALTVNKCWCYDDCLHKLNWKWKYIDSVWRVETKEKQTSHFALEDEHRQAPKESFFK